ncbi:MAG: PqqD family protein [Candidatus Marinimicrobia bacterium]|nr:PqqD family protein [bacterium]MCG2715825.1 PqqD family protein [Candidatus Neomarinimicrobiota bacterium]
MKFKHCDNVDWKEFENESVLLNLLTGYYFRLNQVGTFIWPLINKENNLGDIVNRVVDQFDVSQRQAKADINSFIEQLIAEQLIQKS